MGESELLSPAPEPLKAEPINEGARPSALAHPAFALPPAPAHEVLDQAAHARLVVTTAGLSPTSAWLAWYDWALHLAVSPGKSLVLMLEAAQVALRGLSACVPGTTPATDDRAASGTKAAQDEDPRFADPAWQVWPFSAYRDTFSRVETWWQHAVTGVRGVEAHHERLIRFFARQCADALAPSNFVATNPHVLGTAVRTGGASFAFGARNWLEDFIEWVGYARGPIGKRKPSYLPGRDVASTPGKVVWRNELCELLQYEPATPVVAREPVFIVPSWIMKYYILDLQPHDSLVRYLVAAGYTVFMISWRNPDESFRDVSLDDYRAHGLLAALEAARERCDSERVHAVGYCLGGTLLAIAAAALERHTKGGQRARNGKRSRPFRTMTLLAALTDFTDPGELGIFIDASELAALDALMWEQGYLDGSQMAAALQLLNARDHIWSRMMSEYLLGRRSKANDLMSWNADTTRMPYRMHSEYLHRLFLHNDLAEGRHCVGGRPVALSDIETPTFVVGTERDHVSPWRSVYKLHLLTHHPLTFVLTSGGHNAGIVSELGHAHRHYRVARRKTGMPYRSDDEFLAQTETVEGSWWPCWTNWLHEHSSSKVPARTLDPALPDAPGTYVFQP